MKKKSPTEGRVNAVDLDVYNGFLGDTRVVSREEMIASLNNAASEQAGGLLTMESYDESEHAVCRAETIRRRFKTWRTAQSAANIIQTNIPVRELKTKRLAEHLNRALVHGHENAITDILEALRAYAQVSKLSLGKKHYETMWGSLRRAVRGLANVNKGAISEADYLCGAVDPGDTKGYIYIERHGPLFPNSDLKTYRIGSTRDPDARIAVSRSQSPTRIERVVLRLVSFPRNVERYLHRRLKDRNIKGSHYVLTKDDLEYVDKGPIEADAAKQ